MPLQQIETKNGPLEYTVSSSFGYRFSRYLVLQRITESKEFKSGQPFQLAPMIQAITNQYLTPEEQQAIYPRPNGKPETVFEAIRWYVRFVGRDNKIIEFVERGWYRMPTGEQAVDSDDGIDEEIAEETGPSTEGWIYAFTFPELVKDAPYPIKIGMTIRDVQERVDDQCRNSAAFFSPPKLLKSWPVNQVSLTERTVHGLLKLSGQWKSDAPGSEWFVTTLAEIERIVGVVQRETH